MTRSRLSLLAALCAAFTATGAFSYQLTTTTLNVSSTRIQAGQLVTLVGSVAGTAPTGTVRFYDGTVLLNEVALTNGVAAMQTTALTALGSHPILAAYQGDDGNYPSSGSGSIDVISPPATISGVQPSHLPAGTLDTVVRIRGNGFAVGATVTVNGAPLQSQYESPTLVRAIVPANLLAAQGTVPLVVTTGPGSDGNSAPVALTVDAPGAAPLSLNVGAARATASHLTSGGSSAWLVKASSTDGFTRYTTWVARALTDSDSDGTVVFDTTEQSTTVPLVPAMTNVAVADVATGSVRIDAPPGAARLESFFPMDAVQGVYDNSASRLWLHSVSRLVLWVRPGVGAWVTRDPVANVPFTPSAFTPMPGSPVVPRYFWPDDVIVAIDDSGACMSGVIRDYLPFYDASTPPSLIVDEAEMTLEGDSGVTSMGFFVHLTKPSDTPVSFNAVTFGGTATPSSDFALTSTDEVIPAGQLGRLVSVPVFGDTLNEGDETVLLRITSDTPVLVGTATGTILNDDPLPTISIQDATSVEGSNEYSSRMMAFPLTLSAPRGLPTSGYLDFTGRSANNLDVQLTSASTGGSFSIPAGATSGFAFLPIAGDTVDEDDETFFVDVVAPGGATPGRGRAAGTIIDDDAPPVVALTPVSVVEPTSDLTLRVPINVTGNSDLPLAFDYQLVGQSATTGDDFVAASGTIQFDARVGSHPQLSIPVTVRADALREPVERFSVSISHPVNVTVTPSTPITIADDDAPSRYAAVILRDAPYAYDRLHESGGTVAHDSSGHALDGTFPSSTAFNVPGPLASGDPAVSFGASYDRVTMGGAWAGWTEGSVEGWVQMGSAQGSLGIFPSATLLSSDGITLQAYPEQAYNGVRIWTNSSQISLPVPAITPGWHYLALSVRSGATVLYLDGVPVATSAQTYGTLAGNNLSTASFGGAYAQLDEIAIYKKALSAADVQRHYAARLEIAPRDFDDNGSNDLVLRNGSTGANALWLLNGGAYSSTANLPYLPPDFRIEGSADFDLDGKPDLLLRNYGNGNNALWLMNGTSLGSIVNLPWLPTASDFRFQGTADVNGDGWPDILIRNYTNGNNAAWLMHGGTFLGIANLPALPDPNYRMAGGGDFNGDGKADILWRNQVTGNDAVWLMDGTTLLGVANLPALPNTDYRFNAIADFDGDGKTDIALRNYANGSNALWLLDGTSLRSIVNLPALPNTAYEIVGPR